MGTLGLGFHIKARDKTNLDLDHQLAVLVRDHHQTRSHPGILDSRCLQLQGAKPMLSKILREPKRHLSQPLHSPYPLRSKTHRKLHTLHQYHSTTVQTQ